MEKIQINLPYSTISGTTKETRYQLSVTCNGLDYHTIEDLSNMCMISPRTIERYLKEINEREMWRYVVYINGIRYITPGLLYLNRRYRNKLKNQEHGKWLSTYTWNYAIAIGFEGEASKNFVVDKMYKYWNKLTSCYPDKKVVLFFTTEKYPDGTGYHLHAILGVDEEKQNPKSIKIAKNHFRTQNGDDVWHQQFDNKRCYVDYIVKYLHKDGDGHDILLHNV